MRKKLSKGVVAAGSESFYEAFGANEEEFRIILAMPRDMILFKKHYEDSGETDAWRAMYSFILLVCMGALS